MAIHDDGYALLEAFLAPAEVRALRPRVEHALAAPSAPSCKRPHNTLVPLSWDSPLVAAVLDCPGRIRALRERLDARDLRWISGYLSIKEPYSPPLAWHQDWWCWDHPLSFSARAPQVAVLCYLADTDDASGALRVLPRSHRESTPLHAELPDAHSDASADVPAMHPTMQDQAGQVTLELAAGDAVALDYRLLHGTHPNLCPRRRDCLLLSFTPDWGGLPRDVRGHLIRHPALPAPHDPDPPPAWLQPLLPVHDGERADLPLNRRPPSQFVLTAPAPP